MPFQQPTRTTGQSYQLQGHTALHILSFVCLQACSTNPPKSYFFALANCGSGPTTLTAATFALLDAAGFCHLLRILALLVWPCWLGADLIQKII